MCVRILPLAALLLAAGCLPGRDNPLDPHNVPDVRLHIRDFTEPNSTACGDPEAEGWPEVIAVSRGRCLLVEGADTTDPQGDPLDSLQFTFYVDTGFGLTRATNTTGAIFVLSPALREELPFDKEISVIARVRDRDHAIGRGSATLVLTNLRPVALPAPAIYARVGGYPWQGTSIDVFFDGSASDAGDLEQHAEYCWRFPDASSEVCAETDPLFTRPVDLSTIGRYAARLEVDDGERSTSTWTEVRRGTAISWATTIFGKRIRRFSAPGSPLSASDRAALVATTSSSQRAILTYSGSGLQLVPYPDASPVPPDFFGVAGQLREAGGLGDGRIWALTKEYTLDEVDYVLHNLAADALGNGGLSETSSIQLDSADDDCQEGLEPDLEAAPGGHVWIASRLFGDLRVIDSAMVVNAIEVGIGSSTPGVCTPGEFDDHSYAGVDIRPGTSQAWVGVVPYSTGVGQGPRIEVYDGPLQTAPTRVVPLPWSPGDLGWANESELWIVSVIGGLVRVDVDLLDAGFPLEDAIVASFPELLGFSRLQIDPVTGTCWAEEAEGGRLARVFLDGTVTLTPNGGGIDFIGQDGSGWRSFGGQLQRFEGPGADGIDVDRAIHTTDFRPMAVDASRGWIWAGVGLGVSDESPPWGLQAFDADGRLARLVTGLQDVAGNAMGVPTPDLLRLTADGDTLFLVTGNEADDSYRALARIDLRQNPPMLVAESLDAGLVTLLVGDETTSVGSKLLGPSAPSGDRLWIHDNIVDRTYQIDGTTLDPAPVSTPYVLAAADRSNDVYYGPYAAVLPLSNRLCHVTRGDTVSGNYSVRYIDDAGASAPLLTFPFQDSAGPAYVSTWADGAGNEGCWVAMQYDQIPTADYLVASFDAGGALVDAQFFDGAGFTDGLIGGLAALSGAEAWVDFVNAQTPYRRRVRIPQEDLFLFAEDPSTFIMPFVAATN